ncbi:MAG: ester cyclase [Candidatus Promineifilaceae bacterium]|nr:ester cyclase [Candidatus Promineifilaceae bacterium]
MSEQNKQMVRQAFEAIWNEGDFSVFDARFSADYVGHTSDELEGLEDAKRFVAAMRRAFPDFDYTVEDEIAEEDKVVNRWVVRATHQGEFQGIPATGKQVTITGISIYRVVDGKLVEGWTNADMLGLLQQLGAVPAAG